jgi:hypothetical protein
VLATLTVPATRAGLLLADGLVPDPSGGHKPGFGKAGPVALVVIILLFVAVGFLMRSMTKHVKKVPASFQKTEQDDAEEGETTGQETESDTDRESRPG